MNREQLRAQIFQESNRKPKSKVVKFYGVDVEVRQPLVVDVLEDRSDDGDKRIAMLRLAIKYSYVPGSDDRIFEDGDYDSLKTMPLDESFQNVFEAINTLSSINTKAQEKN